MPEYKFLVIEDDQFYRTYVDDLLADLDVEIISAPDGETGLALAVSEKPDLIITDIEIPKIQGFVLLRNIRERPETRDIPVILMSGKVEKDMLERVMNLSRVRLSNVMVPRRRAAIVPIDIPRADLLRIARMAHFSRLPVYRDDPRRIVGIVNVYHVLTDEQERPIAEYVSETTSLRASETVPGALVKMQQARQVMAIVVDRAGNCLGLFTIKDLVEEIVGDLEAW